MPPRSQLHQILITILGSSNVYFQPPPTVTMLYPAIVYERSDMEPKFADNFLYSVKKKYTVTVIDKDPDSLIPEKIMNLPLCNFDRHFTAENLNHDVFSLYF